MSTAFHPLKHLVLFIANVLGIAGPALVSVGAASAAVPVHRQVTTRPAVVAHGSSADNPYKLYIQLMGSDPYGIEAAENAHDQQALDKSDGETPAEL